MNITKTIKNFTYTVALFSMMKVNSFAQSTDDGQNIVNYTLEFLPNPATADKDLVAFVQRVINLTIGLAGLVAVGFLIYNGIRYIISGGDEAKVDAATKGIIYAILGLIICFIAVLIVTFLLRYVLAVDLA